MNQDEFSAAGLAEATDNVNLAGGGAVGRLRSRSEAEAKRGTEVPDIVYESALSCGVFQSSTALNRPTGPERAASSPEPVLFNDERCEIVRPDSTRHRFSDTPWRIIECLRRTSGDRGRPMTYSIAAAAAVIAAGAC